MAENSSTKHNTVGATYSSSHPQTKSSVPEQTTHMTAVPGQEPESYWMAMAGQRQQATEEAMTENQKLLDQIAAMRKENEALAAIASQKEYMETIAEDVLRSLGDPDKES